MQDLDQLASQLAANRTAGTVSDLPMKDIRSRTDAEAVQAAALSRYANDVKGYALAGTSELCRRSLGLRQPIFVPIADNACFRDQCHIVLPEGTIGAQSELAFTMGAMPSNAEMISRQTIADSILACQPAIGLLGRRTRPSLETDLGAIADFGLHVATICGPVATKLDAEKLDRLHMVARIDGKQVITATGDAVLGHPLNAVVWLARELGHQGHQLSAGDIVTTGSFGPVLQVLPGQHLAVEWEVVGEVSCWFD